VAHRYSECGRLDASVFFSKGGKDISNASQIFTTIAVQLANKSKYLQWHTCEALKKDSKIATQSFSNHWRQLILAPLLNLSRNSHPP
jgi:hypothetical protein